MSLGEQFRDTALGPTAKSASCLAVGKLGEALSHLSRAQMMGAVRGGVETVASMAGVAALSVFKLLPMTALEDLMGEVEKARAKAAARATDAVKAQRGELGASLRSIAADQPAGSELAVALTTVADGIDKWQKAVEECCGLIDEARDIGSAYRRRRMKRFGVFAALAMLVGVGGAWSARRYQADSQVRAVLVADDPCASEKVDEKDMKHVGAELAAEVRGSKKRCNDERERLLQEEEEKRKAEEKKRLENERVEKRQKACQRLSDHLRDNALDATDEGLAGTHAALLKRVAADEIEASDVAQDVSALPCADTPSGATIRSAYVSAMLGSWRSWLAKETPSASMRKLVADVKPELDDTTRTTLGVKIRQQADGAKLSGKPERLAHAAALCELLVALAIVLPRSCDTKSP